MREDKAKGYKFVILVRSIELKYDLSHEFYPSVWRAIDEIIIAHTVNLNYDRLE